MNIWKILEFWINFFPFSYFWFLMVLIHCFVESVQHFKISYSWHIWVPNEALPHKYPSNEWFVELKFFFQFNAEKALLFVTKYVDYQLFSWNIFLMWHDNSFLIYSKLVCELYASKMWKRKKIDFIMYEKCLEYHNLSVKKS